MINQIDNNEIRARSEPGAPFQPGEKDKLLEQLAAANLELVSRNKAQDERAAELRLDNHELRLLVRAKERQVADLLLQIEEMKQKTAALTEASQELEAFAYVSNHDLQEPLRKIQVWIDMLEEKELRYLSEEGIRIIRRIESSAERMRQQIQDLYTYSHVNVAEQRFEEVNLQSLLDEVKQNLSGAILQKKATIKSDLAGVGYVIADQFRQLFLHLLGNSLKFCRPDIAPRVKIMGRTEKGKRLHFLKRLPADFYYHICVSDNGIGFPPQYSQKIFMVFQRLHSPEDYPGTGIGLAIVKKIVEAHKGSIVATGRPGRGAAFNIYIPVRDSVLGLA
jgi:two-component system CheB/CheR fusion protein